MDNPAPVTATFPTQLMQNALRWFVEEFTESVVKPLDKYFPPEARPNAVTQALAAGQSLWHYFSGGYGSSPGEHFTFCSPFGGNDRITGQLRPFITFMKPILIRYRRALAVKTEIWNPFFQPNSRQ